MGARRRSIFRRPVLSRLAWAWIGSLAALSLIGGVFGVLELNGRKDSRISLPVNEIETMARAEDLVLRNEERLESPEDGLRLTAPALPPAGEPAEGEEAADSLLYPEEFDLAENAEPEYSADDIVITIPGAEKPAVRPTQAALTPPVQSIADPDPALMRAGPFGKIPGISPDGRKAMQVYARPRGNPDGRPEVAVIIGGLGLNPALTERAIDDLPPEVSLAFAPYAKDLDYWTQKARRAGHEVLIELPMEGYGDSAEALGRAGLLTSRSAEENLQRLDWLMSRFAGYFAATNYMGQKFSADQAALAPVLTKLREAGVAYIDDTGAARIAAGKTGAALATVNRIVPPAPDDAARNAVRRELRALEKIAERDGAALGKTYAYAVTLDEIAAWIDTLEEKELSAAPASAVLQRRAATR